MGKETTAGNYYEILQISPRADQVIVERAYRLLAKRYHPDNTESGDAGKFGNLAEAYQTLSDPERRAAYDHEHRTDPPSPPTILHCTAIGRPRDREESLLGPLSILYVTRRRDVMKAGVGIVHLERLVGLPFQGAGISSLVPERKRLDPASGNGRICHHREWRRHGHREQPDPKGRPAFAHISGFLLRI